MTEIPNAETIAAMQEADEMLAHPERYKTFRSIEELKAALDAPDELSK